MQQVEWIRNDPEIVSAIRDRLLDAEAGFAHLFMREAGKSGVFHDHPELMDALDTLNKNPKEYV